MEEHNDALTHIYRAIAGKKLPFSETVLVHFDAHPDLLSPEIHADDVTDKDLLFDSVSIAEWILPAIYKGHFGRVVWVKPPWANQIPAGSYRLCVGKDKASGQIRVSSPLSYFIGELLSRDIDELESCIDIPLDVVTLSPSPAPLPDTLDLAATSLPSPKKVKLSGSSEALDDKVEPLSVHEDRDCPRHFSPELLTTVNSARAWVLDIDLDFFSTGNPYRSLYSKEQYYLLQKLYQLQEPSGEVAVRESVVARRKQLAHLETLWREEGIPQETKTELHLSPQDEILIKEMKGFLGTIHKNSFIDTEYLHTSGIVTDLPVHCSSEEEITGLLSTVSQNLKKITLTPTLVTIARSTEDEYTPPTQVESIQQQVLETLRGLYSNGQLLVHHHYNTTAPSTPIATHDMKNHQEISVTATTCSTTET